MKSLFGSFVLASAFSCFAQVSFSQDLGQGREELVLDESCIVSVLNRTVQADENGLFALANIPSFMGAVRARASCIRGNKTIVGQTDFFNVITNDQVETGSFYIGEERIPTALTLNNGLAVRFFGAEQSRALNLQASYADGSTETLDLAQPNHGVNFSTSNGVIATVNPTGVVTSHATGETLLTARKDGVIAISSVAVIAGGDKDGDGMPDSFEDLYGLNPNDPIDAFEDLDLDGLSNAEEFALSTEPNSADSDGDKIEDGEEVVAGSDGYITDPLLADTDGDGLSDGLEISFGFDPLDALSGDLQSVLESIEVTPGIVNIPYNTINSESTWELTVTGHLIDGSTLDLTSTSRGTNYASDNLEIANFGVESGKIYAGAEGSTQVTVTNGDFSVTVPVSVTAFTPQALSEIVVGEGLNKIALHEQFAFVVGVSGLHVIDVSNPQAPMPIGQLELSGEGRDIKLKNGKAYVIVSSGGLAIVDIEEPAAPVLLKMFATPAATDLVLKGDYAIIASGGFGARIVNIRDENNIFEVSGVAAQDVGSGAVTAVEVGGDRLFISTLFSIAVFDIQQLASPVRLFSINKTGVNTLAYSDGVLHVAADVRGWSSYRLNDDGTLSFLAGGTVQEFAPLDIAISKDFVFWSGVSPNLISYTNIQFDVPFFQNVIGFPTSQFSLDTTYGIAVDNQFVYSIDKQRLVIAQYRKIDDFFGVAPSVTLLAQKNSFSLMDYLLEGIAEDDVGVDRVEFYFNGTLVNVDSLYPYQFSFSPMEFTVVGCESFSEVGTLRAKAVDYGGNETWSDSSFIEVDSGMADAQLSLDSGNIELDLDCDRDGLGNQFETNIGTNPALKDSDGDFLTDGEEVARKTDPLVRDSDGDGIEDGAEVAAGTDPLNPDTISPELIESLPAGNAIDVREDTKIGLFFDGPLKRETVTAETTQLLNQNGDVIEAQILLSDDGSSISIQPLRFLVAETAYRISVVGLRDTAGNPAADIAYSFQTGINIELDDVAPRATFLRALGYEEREVPTNVVSTVVFDEPIDSETLTTDSFYLHDALTQERVSGFISLSNDRMLAQLIPSQSLHVGRTYIQFLTADINDLWGNSLGPYNAGAFTTGFSVDARPPEVVATTLPDGLTDVPLNVRLRVRFNERISKHTLRNVQLFKNGELVDANYQINDFGDLITLTPILPLAVSSEYLWQIGAVEDMAGNILESSKTITFETGLVADTVSSRGQEWISFLDKDYWQGRIVPSNIDLRVRLLERIDPTTIELYKFSTFPNGNASGRSGVFNFTTLDTEKLSYSISVSEDTQTLTLLPDAPLVPGTKYQLRSGRGVTDLAGNAVDTSFNMYFNVSGENDTAAPLALLSSFFGENGVLHNGNLIRLNYSEFISERCILGDAIKLTKNDVDIPFEVSLSSNGRTVIVEPDALLSDGDGYLLSLTGICDLAGNQRPAELYNFSVSNSIDDAPPQLIQSPEEPLPAGTSELVWIFNEDLDPSSVVELINTGAGSYGPIFLEGQTVVEGNILRFIPDEPLMQGRQYVTAGNSTWITDSSGNKFPFLSFYTAIVNDTVPPSVIATSPVDGAINVSPNQPVIIQFSESINFENATFSFWAFGELSSPTVLLSPDRTLVTLYGMPSDRLMSLVILGATDYSGNVLPNHILTYTTGRDDGASSSSASIDALIPAVGATGLTRVPEILLHSKYSAINEATLVDGFKVYVNNIEVTGSIKLIGEGKVMRFVPDEPFQKGDRVDYQVHYTVTDVVGRSLGSFNGFFTLADDNEGVGKAASVVGFYPAAGADNVPINTSIDVLFNEAIDPVSLAENLLLADQNGNDVSVTAVVDSANDKLVTLQASAALLNNHTYTLNVLGGLTDTDGDLVALGYSSQFTTGNGWFDDRAPILLSTTPSDGADDVSINAFITAKYDEPINPLRIQSGGDLYHAQLTQDNTVVRYQFKYLHAANKLKELQLPVVEDGAKNRALDSMISFTVGAGFNDDDFRSPTVVQGDNAIAEFIFEKPVDPLSVSAATIVLRLSGGGESIPLVIDLVDGNTTVYVSPAEILPVGQYRYSIQGVHDLSGNVINTSSSFSINQMLVDERAPVLLKARVPNGLSDVPLTISLALVFDEIISTASFDDIKLLSDLEEPVEVTIIRSGTTVTIIPRFLLQPNSKYTLIVEGVSDLSGNGMGSENNMYFETGGAVGPETRPAYWVTPPLIDNTPSDDPVPVNTLVKVGFDRAVDTTRLSESTGRLKFADIIDVTADAPDYDVGVRVQGSITLSDDLKTLSIAPIFGWRDGLVYRVAWGESEGSYSWSDNPTISAYSISGEEIRVSSRSILFRTASSREFDVTPPGVLRTEPVALSSVDTLVRVKVFLDELLSPACEEQQVITLANASGVTTLDSSFSLLEKSLSVWVASSLVSGANTFTFSGACDVAGNVMSPFSFDFTVAE